MLRGLASLLALLAGLVGIPAALVFLGGNPLPSELSWRSVGQALLQPDDGSILIGLITVVGWLAWLVFAVSVAVELAALASGFRFHVQLPGLGGAQRLSAGLLLAVVTMVTSPLPAAQAAPALASEPIVSTASSEVTPQNHMPNSVVGKPSAQLPALERAGVKAAASAGRGERQMMHEVSPGDDLWSLAEHYYGEGRQWRKIAQANPERLTGGPDRLQPGWRLAIPDVDAPEGSKAASATVTVTAGDSLWTIAERTYGDSARWADIFAANRAQLSDPDALEVGIQLVLPGDDHVRREVPPPERESTARESADDADEGGSAPTQPTPRPVEPRDESTSPGDREASGDDQPTLAPAPAPPAPADRSEQNAMGGERGDLVDVALGVGAVGGLLAAGLVAGVATRRRLQLQRRPVGRQIRPPGASTQLVETAMGRRQRPLSRRTLDLALRAVSAHCRATDTPLPALALAKIAPDLIELVMTDRTKHAPVGFGVSGRSWMLESQDARYLSSVPGIAEAVRPYPALVSLGTVAERQQVVVDLEAVGLLSVQADDPALVEAALAAVALELSFSLGADELFLTLVGGSDELVQALGKHNVTQTDEVDELLDRLEQRAARQRDHQQHTHPAQNRVDPNFADAWAPEILLITCGLTTGQESRLRAVVLDEPRVTVTAVVAGPVAAAPWSLQLHSSGAGQPTGRVPDSQVVTAVLDPLGLQLVPQLLPSAARRAVVDLVAVTGSEETGPAPWWDHDQDPPADPPPDNVTYLGKRSGGWGSLQPDHQQGPHPEGTDNVTQQVSQTGGMVSHHPVLLMLGPVELTGATGALPSRAAKACLEYCGWLLEHPGTTAQAMATALVVAEGTRRSNMSRLRSWLGEDSEHNPYLPDAYSGRIFLHPSVSSDWHRLQILTAGGVNRTSTSSLRAALELVRGAPLADAAPGQWPWAETLRTDMISVIRDIGVEVAQRALAEHDIDLARWAASRALLAAPGDELLMAARIRTEHHAGNVAETERLTLQLAAQARSLGVDLDNETVVLLQEVMEGRVRARMA